MIESTRVRDAIVRKAREFYNDDVEIALLFSSVTGELLDANVGDHNSVDKRDSWAYTDRIFRVFVHNHPGNDEAVFSVNDVLFLLSHEFGEFWAVGRLGGLAAWVDRRRSRDERLLEAIENWPGDWVVSMDDLDRLGIEWLEFSNYPDNR